jgi:hypothetical protein
MAAVETWAVVEEAQVVLAIHLLDLILVGALILLLVARVVLRKFLSTLSRK